MLAAAESMPDHPKHAERLYDAAGASRTPAWSARRSGARNELIKAHPNDPLAQKALFRIAAGYHQLAYYSEAAEHYEDFATKFPGEKEAPDALGNAYDVPGRPGRVRQGHQGPERLHPASTAPSKPQEAADVFFQMGEVYEKRRARPTSTSATSRTTSSSGARKGSVEKQILAHFRWASTTGRSPAPGGRRTAPASRSSAWRPPAGRRRSTRSTSASRTRTRRSRRRSGPSAGRPPSPRSPCSTGRRNFANTAQTHFATALKLFNNGAGAQQDPDRAGQAGPRERWPSTPPPGRAFYQGEKLYEDFLRLKFPEGLELQPPNNFDYAKKAAAKKKRFEEDRKKLVKYMTDKSTLAVKLAGRRRRQQGRLQQRPRVQDRPLGHRRLGPHRPGVRELRRPAVHRAHPPELKPRTSGA